MFARSIWSRRSLIAVAAAGFVALTTIAAAPARATPASEAFIQDTIDKGYVILNNTSLSDEERRRQFKAFMLGLTDVRRIGTFTLGQYANAATPAQVDDFVAAFTDYLVAVYETRLIKYRGLTMKVVGSDDSRGPNDSVVNAEVINPATPNARRTRAAFRVRPDASGRPIITDMQVEGIWVAVTQRADFTSYLQQNNSSVPALTNHLRAQARMLWSTGGAG
jgi:phospholipid transport system substrate-binding protein